MERPNPGSLTLRERQTIALLAHGLTVREAADLMCLSPRTVENHRHSAYGKLGIHRRGQAVRWAIQHGLDRMTPINAAALYREHRDRIRDNSPAGCP